MTHLEQFCQDFQGLVDENLEWPDFLARGRQMVGALAGTPGWLNETLSRLVLDEVLLQNQYHSGDPNDIILFRSPSRDFSVRAFIWEPNLRYPIHDHGSWGIVGAHLNRIKESKYRRLDNGARDGYAEIEKSGEAILTPGETTVVLPLDEGLHQMEAPDGLAAISLHVYGRPVRKGYIQQFDAHYNSVYRVYPPHLQKKVLAMRALSSFSDQWPATILKEAAATSSPDYMARESQRALDFLESRISMR